MFPKFNWTTDSNDLWYGFLIMDDNAINHQYDQAGLYVPCNTPVKSSENPYCVFGSETSDRDEWFNYSAGTSGKFINNDIADSNIFLQPDGLAGWAYDFKRHKINNLFQP